MKLIRKYSDRNYLKAGLKYFILLFFLLSSGNELFHNHEIDLEIHDDCPVHLFLSELQSTIVFTPIAIEITLFFISLILLFQPKFHNSENEFINFHRGPPVLLQFNN